MPTDFMPETEFPGRKINSDTLRIIAHRYYWTSRLISGKKVLEVGCGPGLGVGWLLRHGRHVVGGDLTQESLKLAKKHYGAKMEFVCMDAHQLPIKDHCLDVVVCLAALIYMYVPGFLDECHRVLRRGGMLLVNTPNKSLPGFRPSLLSHRYYSVPELYSLLEEHHFDTQLFGAFRTQHAGARNERKLLGVGRTWVGRVLRSVGLQEWVKRIMGLETLSITLKEELGEDDMRLVEDVSVVPLSCDSPDLQHRIVYAIAQAR